MAFGFLEHLHPARLPAERMRFTHTFCLGGVSFLLFIVLGLSGAVLMFSYVPTPEGAARFFAREAGNLPFAWYLRRLHFLAGQTMVAALLLHMARVMAQRAFLPPRATNWLIGLALLVVTLGLDFTGYVLRWDGPTRDAAIVAAGLMDRIPAVGPLFQRLLLGGATLGEASLLRFYVLHCLALPGLLLSLTLYHFWRIRKDNRKLGGL